MYPFLAEKVIYPLGDLAIGTSVMRYYQFLEQTQWWTPARLRELQDGKLRALMGHAYNNVPYYRRLLESLGLSDKDIQCVDDLVKLPILTKQEIRQNSLDIRSSDFKKRKPVADATGGSTGEPLRYHVTMDAASINWAGIFRGWGWGGYRIGDKRLAFGGSSLVPNTRPTILELVRDRMERNLRISAVSMTDEKYEQTLRRIRRYRNRFVYGYPSAVYLLADYCKMHGVDDIRFDAMFSTAEVLLPQYREAIEHQFHCKVFDNYGSYDGGGQALECERHQGFHISVEKAVMEVVDQNGRRVSPGTSGRIIVTDLHNYAMPFIRYEVGDTGILTDKPCACGRGLPLLEALEGRIPDSIKFSNGVTLSGAAVPCMLKNCHIKQFQLVQTADDELLIKLVKDTDYSEEDAVYIKNVLEHHCRQGVKIGLEFCSAIPPGPSGKFRFILSKR